MSPADFLLRLGCALLCGVFIGVERQWRQRTAGLRTYTLVAVGSALFVMLATLTHDNSNPTRIAGQIVTGVGFLGAGVIMRSGLNVRGLNTAGSIWCSSAVGTLAGSGFYWQSFVGAALVLAINTLLRPLVALINRQPVDPSEQEFRYSLQLTCRAVKKRSCALCWFSLPPFHLSSCMNWIALSEELRPTSSLTLFSPARSAWMPRSNSSPAV
jgi:putative Mg2+ transporter-C (MgtC) family protein